MLRSEIKPALSASGESHANPRLDFEIVAETADYAVVNKPPFLLVHPTKPNGPRTLWGELRELFAYELANGGQVSIVNRLDRETSGLVLVAKTAAAARQFGLLMQKGRVAKEYLALVWGWPEWDTRLVDAPLLRQGTQTPSAIYLKQAIHPAGLPAQTEFRVERRFQRETSAGSRFALVRAIPLTGRTHQIRVHLNSIGHPLIGDPVYGITQRRSALPAAALEFSRQALHAARLALTHPVTKEELSWESALPADISGLIDLLNNAPPA